MVIGKFISKEYPVTGAIASSYSFHYMLNVNRMRTTVLLAREKTTVLLKLFGAMLGGFFLEMRNKSAVLLSLKSSLLKCRELCIEI